MNKEILVLCLLLVSLFCGCEEKTYGEDWVVTKYVAYSISPRTYQIGEYLDIESRYIAFRVSGVYKSDEMWIIEFSEPHHGWKGDSTMKIAVDNLPLTYTLFGNATLNSIIKFKATVRIDSVETNSVRITILSVESYEIE